MLNNIKSKVILKSLFNYISEEKNLNLIKYNNKLKKKFKITIDDYKRKHYQIKIEIIPEYDFNEKRETNKFINRLEDKSLYHIYFDTSKNEIDREYIKKNEKVSKIIIILEKELISLKRLFDYCLGVKEIKFINFYRTDILDISYMFGNCYNLIKLDISKMITDNTMNMEGLFSGCSKIKEINVSNIKIDKAENISHMFYSCENLENINLSHFKTDNVNNMSYLFEKCSNLKEIDLSNFKTDKVKDMTHMFYECFSLVKLDISNFNFNKDKNNKSLDDGSSLTKIDAMFYGCSEDLMQKIGQQRPEINIVAYIDDCYESYGSNDSFSFNSDEIE